MWIGCGAWWWCAAGCRCMGRWRGGEETGKALKTASEKPKTTIHKLVSQDGMQSPVRIPWETREKDVRQQQGVHPSLHCLPSGLMRIIRLSFVN